MLLFLSHSSSSSTLTPFHRPVRDIAAASVTGHGTNIITGVAVGMKSTVIPVISVSISVLLCYHIGAASGVGSARSAGLD
jgi:Na+/H+-translocating membrane pyrophosphatase